MDLTANQGDDGRRLVNPAGVTLSVCPPPGSPESSSAVRLPVVPPVRAVPLKCPPANSEPPSMEGGTLLQRLGGILSMWTSQSSQSTVPLPATWQPSDPTVTPPGPMRNVGPRRAGQTHSPRRPRPEPTPTPPAAKCYRMASEDSDAEMPELQPPWEMTPWWRPRQSPELNTVHFKGHFHHHMMTRSAMSTSQSRPPHPHMWPPESSNHFPLPPR